MENKTEQLPPWKRKYWDLAWALDSLKNPNTNLSIIVGDTEKALCLALQHELSKDYDQVWPSKIQGRYAQGTMIYGRDKEKGVVGRRLLARVLNSNVTVMHMNAKAGCERVYDSIPKDSFLTLRS